MSTFITMLFISVSFLGNDLQIFLITKTVILPFYLKIEIKLKVIISGAWTSMSVSTVER